MRTSDLDILFFLDEKGTKVMFDGSDKPRLALAHTITKVHLNKRNISQPERMIQFEFPYIYYRYTRTRVHTSKILVTPLTPKSGFMDAGVAAVTTTAVQKE